MNPFLIAVILATVSLSAIAQIALKAGVSSPQIASQMSHGGLAAAVAMASSPFIWLGLGIYGASVIAWLWVLSKVEVSLAYPFAGISFVLTALMGWLFLHENVTALRLAGTLLVAAGCVLIARSA